MKKLSFTTVLCLLFAVFAFSQEKTSKAQQLNQQMINLYRQGNFDEAVLIAEQIVKIQRAEQPVNNRNLLNSLESLAQLKLVRYRQALEKLKSPASNSENISGILERMPKDAEEVENALREALALTGKTAKEDVSQIIGLKSSLAWILYNFMPPDNNISVGFDKESRNTFEKFIKLRFYKRIDEAEILYSAAQKSSEAAFGIESDETFSSSYDFAEFYMATGSFENAIPLYEKSIGITEKQYGKDSQRLLSPLSSYFQVLTATAQDELAHSVVNRIAAITGKSEEPNKGLLNLTLRADKSFTTANAPSIEQKAMANKERIELRGRGSVFASGATGGSAHMQLLGSSTFGKSYYEDSRSIRLINIGVKIVVNETGKVVEAEALTANKEYKSAAEKLVREWIFKPYNLNGKPTKLRGYTNCLFLDERSVK